MSATTEIDYAILPTPLETRTRARLEELKSNRERFMVEAQRNLAALDAAIAELGALLDPDSVGQNGATEPDGG